MRTGPKIYDAFGRLLSEDVVKYLRESGGDTLTLAGIAKGQHLYRTFANNVTGGVVPLGTARLSRSSASLLELSRGVVPISENGDWSQHVLGSPVTLSNSGLLARGLYGIYAYGSVGAVVLEARGETNVFDCNTQSNSSESLRSAGAQTKLAQSFKVSVAGPLDAVAVQIRKIASPVGFEWFTIEADSGGAPSGTPLATSERIDVSTLQTTAVAAFQTVRFPVPVSLATATTYWLVLQGDFTISGVNYTDWVGSTTDVYADGSAKRYDGAAWSAASGPLDFGPRGYISLAHSTDSAYGVETLASDSSRALVGMAMLNAAGEWVDAATQRLVLSWFDRRLHAAQANAGGNPSTTATSYVNLATANDIEFLTWGDEAVLGVAMAAVSNTQTKYVAMQIYFDDTSEATPNAQIGTVPIASQYIGLGVAAFRTLVEGYHKMSVYGLVEAGTGTWITTTFAPTLVVRG